MIWLQIAIQMPPHTATLGIPSCLQLWNIPCSTKDQIHMPTALMNSFLILSNEEWSLSPLKSHSLYLNHQRELNIDKGPNMLESEGDFGNKGDKPQGIPLCVFIHSSPNLQCFVINFLRINTSVFHIPSQTSTSPSRLSSNVMSPKPFPIIARRRCLLPYYQSYPSHGSQCSSENDKY